MAGFQKTDFGVSSAEGAGNTKIGFIMRIAAKPSPFFQIIGKIAIFRYTLLVLSQTKLQVKTFTVIVFCFTNACVLICKTLLKFVKRGLTKNI